MPNLGISVLLQPVLPSHSGAGVDMWVPHKVVNPVLMAGMLITTSQSLLPKKLAPGDPLVFEFAAIQGGTVSNIVPDNVVMKGSIRVSSPDQLEEMIDRFEEVTRGIVELSGGDFTLEYQKGYPTIFNDPDLLNVWQGAAAKVVGMDRVLIHDKIMTGGDDAAYFQQKVPGVYWWLGIRNEDKGFIHTLHSPHFDFNEKVLAIGAAVQAQAAVDYLEE